VKNNRPAGASSGDHTHAAYLELHRGTVKHYDFHAGTFQHVDQRLIKATRSPWMGSRISRTQEEWFIDRGHTAPWADVQADAQLADADPVAAGGLYDRAEALWDHFWKTRPANVSTAKLSKVLYLMRPALFPILDSNLIRFYRAPAREAAAKVAQTRPSLRPCKVFYWEAIRQDILSSQASLRALRQVLPATENPLAERAARTLTDSATGHARLGRSATERLLRFGDEDAAR
jgi:Family of unknown function (DUF6308)